jgi:hypothetical protein
MNCLDCAGTQRAVAAVGICHDCGAGVCADHAQVAPRWLTRTAAINRTFAVEPPARVVRCAVCEVAQRAASSHPASRSRDEARAR